MTQRRIARNLKCDRKTVARKFVFLAMQARDFHERTLAARSWKPEQVQFDEMESFEHTRLKPLSIALAVTGDGKSIIDAQVGTLNYKGRLAHIAYRKYGSRVDTSREARERTLNSVSQVISKNRPLHIVTDAKPSYAREVQLVLGCITDVSHTATPNRKNQTLYCVNPTRRKNVNDPLFWLNHISARIRHDTSRMLRKVWITTKKSEYLQAHLNLYIAYYNGYKLPI